MAKLHNVFFPDEFRDYLLANEFFQSDSPQHQGREYFFKDTTCITVFSNTLTVHLSYDEEKNQHGSGFTKQSSFDGLHTIGIFEFMLLMHIMGAVTMKQFLQKVMVSDVDDAKKVSDLFSFLGSVMDPSKILTAH